MLWINVFKRNQIPDKSRHHGSFPYVMVIIISIIISFSYFIEIFSHETKNRLSAIDVSGNVRAQIGHEPSVFNIIITYPEMIGNHFSEVIHCLDEVIHCLPTEYAFSKFQNRP